MMDHHAPQPHAIAPGSTAVLLARATTEHRLFQSALRVLHSSLRLQPSILPTIYELCSGLLDRLAWHRRVEDALACTAASVNGTLSADELDCLALDHHWHEQTLQWVAQLTQASIATGARHDVLQLLRAWAQRFSASMDEQDLRLYPFLAEALRGVPVARIEALIAAEDGQIDQAIRPEPAGEAWVPPVRESGAASVTEPGRRSEGRAPVRTPARIRRLTAAMQAQPAGPDEELTAQPSRGRQVRGRGPWPRRLPGWWLGPTDLVD